MRKRKRTHERCLCFCLAERGELQARPGDYALISRRHFLQGAGGLVGAAVATGLYSWQVEPRWVQTTQRSMPVHHLPPALVGRTVAQLSDLHIGNRSDWRYQIGALQRLAATKPDFVVYTGDFVTYDTAEQLDQLAELLRDAVHGTLGTVAVLGNHDYGHDWAQTEVADRIVALLAAHDIGVLRNTVATFSGLQLAGLDDYWSPNFNPDFVTTLDPAAPTIVLCHNPDAVDLPVWQNYRGWILAGHTHGGQVKPPFLPPPLLPVQNKRYTAGTFDLDGGRTLYINRGLGNLRQVRFNVRPELTVFTLTQA